MDSLKREKKCIIKLYDEKSQTYSKSSDFNSLSKLERHDWNSWNFISFTKDAKHCLILLDQSILTN